MFDKKTVLKYNCYIKLINGAISAVCLAACVTIWRVGWVGVFSKRKKKQGMSQKNMKNVGLNLLLTLLVTFSWFFFFPR